MELREWFHKKDPTNIRGRFSCAMLLIIFLSSFNVSYAAGEFAACKKIHPQIVELIKFDGEKCYVLTGSKNQFRLDISLLEPVGE